jgi:hypothetical protein
MKYKICSLFLMIILFSVFNSYSQVLNIGLLGGINHTFTNTDIVNEIDNKISYKTRPISYNFGIYLDYFNKNLKIGIQTGIKRTVHSYIMNWDKYDYIFDLGSNSKIKYRLSSLEVPLICQYGFYTFNKKLFSIIVLGPCFNFVTPTLWDEHYHDAWTNPNGDPVFYFKESQFDMDHYAFAGAIYTGIRIFPINKFERLSLCLSYTKYLDYTVNIKYSYGLSIPNTGYEEVHQIIINHKPDHIDLGVQFKLFKIKLHKTKLNSKENIQN